jgi:predicted GNAT family N-acyltransferase
LEAFRDDNIYKWIGSLPKLSSRKLLTLLQTTSATSSSSSIDFAKHTPHYPHFMRMMINEFSAIRSELMEKCPNTCILTAGSQKQEDPVLYSRFQDKHLQVGDHVVLVSNPNTRVVEYTRISKIQTQVHHSMISEDARGGDNQHTSNQLLNNLFTKHTLLTTNGFQPIPALGEDTAMYENYGWTANGARHKLYGGRATSLSSSFGRPSSSVSCLLPATFDLTFLLVHNAHKGCGIRDILSAMSVTGGVLVIVGDWKQVSSQFGHASDSNLIHQLATV